MRIIKKTMNGMMPMMMKGLTKEEKMELMDNMMPMMLDGVNMLELMPKMTATMLPILIEELKQLDTKDILPKLMGKALPAMKEMMDMMDKDKMVKMQDRMLVKMMKDEKMKKFMPQTFVEMMPIMMPGCLNIFLRELPEKERNEYTKKMTSIFLQHLDKEDRKKLLQQN